MKIWQEYSKREKRNVWKCRFELHGKTKRIKAATRRELENMIAAVRRQADVLSVNKKHRAEMPRTLDIPTAQEVFDKFIPEINKRTHRTMTRRVADEFLGLLKKNVYVTDLKAYHFQLYINKRKSDINRQSGKAVTAQTINKEVAAIRAVLRRARFAYPDLENWNPPPVQMLPEKDSTRDLNIEIVDFYRLLAELRKPRQGKQNYKGELDRRRLADELEFRLETGLRRKEVARLEFKQYKEGILRNVRRWKTDTVTKVFPLTTRAIEIIESRKTLQKDCPYIFTKDGETVESSYRTLKRICAELGINYGRYEQDGFVAHDLRKVFASHIIQYTDIETARELLAHQDIKMTQRYLQTNPQRLKDAIRKSEGFDVDKELIEIYEKVKQGRISIDEFILEVKRLFLR